MAHAWLLRNVRCVSIPQLVSILYRVIDRKVYDTMVSAERYRGTVVDIGRLRRGIIIIFRCTRLFDYVIPYLCDEDTILRDMCLFTQLSSFVSRRRGLRCLYHLGMACCCISERIPARLDDSSCKLLSFRSVWHFSMQNSQVLFIVSKIYSKSTHVKHRAWKFGEDRSKSTRKNPTRHSEAA